MGAARSSSPIIYCFRRGGGKSSYRYVFPGKQFGDWQLGIRARVVRRSQPHGGHRTRERSNGPEARFAGRGSRARGSRPTVACDVDDNQLLRSARHAVRDSPLAQTTVGSGSRMGGWCPCAMPISGGDWIVRSKSIRCGAGPGAVDPPVGNEACLVPTVVAQRQPRPAVRTSWLAGIGAFLGWPIGGPSLWFGRSSPYSAAPGVEVSLTWRYTRAKNCISKRP